MSGYCNVSKNWINLSLSNSLNGMLTQNLVYAFDASRVLSYPGSGSIITDLTGSSVIGTLTNQFTYNDTNLGSLVFNGTDAYIALSNGVNTYNPILLSQTCSVYAWVKPYSFKTNPVLDDITGGPANVGLRISNTGNLIYHQYDGQWNLYESNGSTVPINKWSLITFTRAASNLGPVKMYINTELVYTLTVTSPRMLAGGNMTTIGTSFVGSKFHGEISMVLVYSTEHIQSQILQHFNIYRKRYGI